MAASVAPFVGFTSDRTAAEQQRSAAGIEEDTTGSAPKASVETAIGSTVQGLKGTFTQAVPLLGTAWNAVSTKSELQTRMLAITRTLVGLALLRFFVISAAIGAISVASHPPIGRVFLKMIDDMVNGLVGNMNFAYRYMLPFIVTGLLVCFPHTVSYVPFLATAGEILSFKLGADLMLKNYAKETVMISSNSVEL